MIQNLPLILSISFINFLLVKFLIRIFIPVFKEKYIDNPNSRSMHDIPKPTGGAILIIISTLFLYLIMNLLLNQFSKENNAISIVNQLLIISSIIGTTGFIDDLNEINMKLKFGIQALVSILIIYYSNFYSLEGYQAIYYICSYFALIILISGIINLINFMDGIDGLVCGMFSFVFFILSIKLNIFLLPLSAGFLSFLFINWSPSKMFMGDAGSTFIGAIFAGLIINTTSLIEAISIFLLITPLLIDASYSMIKRIVAGQNIFKPHKLHLYQRLVQNGMSHAKVSFIYISSCLFISIFYLCGNLLLESLSVFIVFVIGILLEKKYALPFDVRKN